MAKSQSSSHRLGAPDPAVEPLRVNAYEMMRTANAELTPFFPYLGPGAIVPAGAIMRGGEEYGRFFHRNTQDEVLLSLGGINNSLQAGMMLITGKMHEVSASLTLAEPADPESCSVAVITQRQASDGDQNETLLFRCMECNERLFDFSYDASHGAGRSAEAYGGRDDDAYPMFPTMWGSAAAADEFNKSEENRTCKSCGHVNPELPIEHWGWREWVLQHRVVNEARRSLDLAMHEMGAAKAPA